MELFEIATRKKYRFPYKGLISVEDLWDLSMRELDAIYKALSKEVKTEQEEDSLMDETKADSDLLNMIEIVKQVFSFKKAEAEKQKKAAENIKKKERLMEILAQKQDAALANKSEEEIMQMLSDLE